MSLPTSLRKLIKSLKILPGVGDKSAQRIALHLVEQNKSGALLLAEVLKNAIESIKSCEKCRAMSESNLCDICMSDTRDKSVLCIVGSPLDVISLEHAGYDGLYFVLRGNISPLDGIGPETLGLEELVNYIKNTDFKEIILATNPTVEGEATAHYLAQYLVPFRIKITRIAHGVPLGGELELIDGGTLAHALAGRRLFN